MKNYAPDIMFNDDIIVKMKKLYYEVDITFVNRTVTYLPDAGRKDPAWKQLRIE